MGKYSYCEHASDAIMHLDQAKKETDKIKSLINCSDVKKTDVLPFLELINENIKKAESSIEELDEEKDDFEQKNNDNIALAEYLQEEINSMEENNFCKTMDDGLKMEILIQVKEKYTYVQLCEKFPEFACLAFKK